MPEQLIEAANPHEYVVCWYVNLPSMNATGFHCEHVCSRVSIVVTTALAIGLHVHNPTTEMEISWKECQ